MAGLFEILRVEVGPRKLTARVHLADDAPVMTSDDLEGTARIYYLLPDIVDHVCLGDRGKTFKEVMGSTELAHLLEHVTVELLAKSNIAGDKLSGRTFEVPGDTHSWDIELTCTDDVLVAGALVSASWLLEWAYTDGSEPEPDVEATVQGLVSLIESLDAADMDVEGTDDNETPGAAADDHAELDEDAADDSDAEDDTDTDDVADEGDEASDEDDIEGDASANDDATNNETSTGDDAAADDETSASDDAAVAAADDDTSVGVDAAAAAADDLLDSMPTPRVLR